jgi:NADH dehydrogenase [ubiquinone] 1 alpha subcomplex assembly factor 5
MTRSSAGRASSFSRATSGDMHSLVAQPEKFCNKREMEIEVFDRFLLRQRRARAAAGFAAHRFLFDEVEDRLCDRLADVKRRFPLAVNLGAHDGGLTTRLSGRNGIETVLQLELSPALASLAAKAGPVAVADAEFLPLASASTDLIVSALDLHWVNDLPGALLQIRQALKPDGLFLAALMGGETLPELRQCLMEAELSITGGVSPRLSPFADVRTLGSLLQRAGFALPVVDRDCITVTYADPLKLLYDLRGMGATNATRLRPKKPLRRAVLLEALRLYREKYAEADGRVPASFEVIYLSGWAPHDSQPKALKPGSATHGLEDVLRTVSGQS